MNEIPPLLENYFRRFGIKVSDKAKSESAVEFFAESGVVAIMALAATMWSKNKFVTYGIEPRRRVSSADNFIEMIEQITRMVNLFENPADNLNNLYRLWENEYYRSHIEYKLVDKCDENGENCRLVQVQETVWDWEEPEVITQIGFDKEKIEKWQRTIFQIQKRMGALRSGTSDSYDFSPENPLEFKQNILDSDQKSYQALILYSAIALAFCFYEEGLETVAEVKNTETLVKSTKYIKRRSILKMIGAALAGTFIRKYQVNSSNENQNLLTNITNKADDVTSKLDVSPTDNFVRFFGQTPDQIRNNLIDIIVVTEKVLSSNYSGSFANGDKNDWNKIIDEIRKTNLEAKAALTDFESLFQYNQENNAFTIPQEITTASKYLWGTQEIISYVSKKSTNTKINHLLAGMMAAIGLTSLAGIIELALPLSDEAKHKVNQLIDKE